MLSDIIGMRHEKFKTQIPQPPPPSPLISPALHLSLYHVIRTPRLGRHRMPHASYAVARGRVQGVGYRYFVTDCAREAGVCGFVKNKPDGSVLIVAEGGWEALRVFQKLVRASDEPVIRIDTFSVSTGEANGEFAGFWVRW
jgi:acylphosphatase